MVTPVTFRPPVVTAWMAGQVDALSEGRLVLGMGAGWNEQEHKMFGVPFYDTKTRLGMLEEALEMTTRLFQGDGPVSFQGAHFRWKTPWRCNRIALGDRAFWSAVVVQSGLCPWRRSTRLNGTCLPVLKHIKSAALCWTTCWKKRAVNPLMCGARSRPIRSSARMMPT